MTIRMRHPIGTLCRCAKPAYANISDTPVPGHRENEHKTSPEMEISISVKEIVEITGYRKSFWDNHHYIFATLDGSKVGSVIDNGFLIPLSPLEQLAYEAE